MAETLTKAQKAAVENRGGPPPGGAPRGRHHQRGG